MIPLFLKPAATTLGNRLLGQPSEDAPTVRAHGYTLQGTRHGVNQDRFCCDERRGLFIVADGMGGHRAGERAAQMAVEGLAYHAELIGLDKSDSRTICQAIDQAFQDVNQEIYLAANADSRLYGMGSTGLLALHVDGQLYLGSLGDSRAYLYRAGEMRQLTVDHNMAQTLVQLGVITHREVPEHHFRHMLWKYLGIGSFKGGADVINLRLEPGDRVVLVTDGITETLGDDDLAMILNRHPATNDAAEALVRSAVARGTRDDATSLVLQLQ